jgi:lipoteichoic acid synthase
VLDVATTLVLIGDLVHVQFYGDVLSVSEISQARLLASVFPSIRATLDRWTLLYFLDWPIVLWLARRDYSKDCEVESRKRLKRFLPVMLVGIVLIGLAANRLTSAAHAIGGESAPPRTVIARVGLLAYHALDLTNARASTRANTTAELDEVKSFLEQQHRLRQMGDLFGIASRANLILISAESLQSFVIGLRVGGQLVAPNLTSLATDSLYFGNFLDQTSLGTTSDAEFAVLQGLHSLPIRVSTRVLAQRILRTAAHSDGGWVRHGVSLRRPRVILEHG